MIINNCIYFASPWFTPEQEEREERLKKELRNLGFRVWSPKEICVCPPDASDSERERVFEDNIDGILLCDIIFVVTDGKDMGTIWEAGYACGLKMGLHKVIVYYCETLPKDGVFNLMLAQSADIVLTNMDELKNLRQLILNGEKKRYVGKIE